MYILRTIHESVFIGLQQTASDFGLMFAVTTSNACTRSDCDELRITLRDVNKIFFFLYLLSIGFVSSNAFNFDNTVA